MEQAKAAVQNFTSKRGHHTDVVESVNPAVTSETIKPHRHEEVQEAVDREVHQDHYHTTVQPIQHQEVLPEKHHHQMRDVSHKEFEHGDDHETRQRLERERAQFAGTSTTHETRHTSAAAPVVEGEHVHHHVHETVQPIVHKETITPEVVHTTVPIHETHHASSQHHGISTLPMKTLDSFKSGGGILEGGKTASHENYEGAPRPYNRELMNNPTEADMNPGYTGLDGPKTHHTGGTDASMGRDGQPGAMSEMSGRPDSGYAGSNPTGGAGYGPNTGKLTREGYTSQQGNQFGATTDHIRQSGNTNTSNTTTETTTEHKPSMMEKIKRAI